MKTGTNIKALAVLVAGISAHLALAFDTTPSRDPANPGDIATGDGTVLDPIEDAPLFPEGVTIRAIQHAGTGCRSGSIFSQVTADASSFTLFFDGLRAEAGPGLPLSASRKNCQMAIDLDVPEGWSFSIMSLEYVGFADVDRGASAQLKTLFYFQGSADGVSIRTTFPGGFFGDFGVHEDVGIETGSEWSTCGVSRALNVNTSVIATAPRGRSSLIMVDSVDGHLTQTFGLRWRRCE